MNTVNIPIDKLKRSCEKELGYIADREHTMLKRALKDSPVWKRKAADQLKRTADACAMDMLFQKFVQGLPIVGVLGGISNPVYYNRIMGYVKTKYHKAYVIGLLKEM